MSLIRCPECGKEISDKARCCPNCGCPRDEMTLDEAQKPDIEDLNSENNGKPQILVRRVQEEDHNSSRNYNRNVCPKCNTEIQENSTVCPKCGYILVHLNGGCTETCGGQSVNGYSALGIIGFAISILSLLTCVFLPIYIILLPISFACCFIAKRQNKYTEKGLATAGEIICLVSILIAAFITALSGNSKEPINNKNEYSENRSTTKERKRPAQEKIKETIPDQVIYDNNGVIITAETLFYDGNSDAEIGINIQNNSAYNLSFKAKYVSVNNIEVETNMYQSVAAGKRADTTLKISTDSLQFSGIDKIGTINTIIWAYDDAVSHLLFETSVLHITTSIGDLDKTTELNGDVVYSENGVTLEYFGLAGDTNSLIFSIKNETERYFDFEIINVSRNDTMLEKHQVGYLDGGFTSGGILPGAKNFVAIPAFVNSIDNIQYGKYEFSVKLRPEGDYFSEYETNPILVNFNE